MSWIQSSAPYTQKEPQNIGMSDRGRRWTPHSFSIETAWNNPFVISATSSSDEIETVLEVTFVTKLWLEICKSQELICLRKEQKQCSPHLPFTSGLLPGDPLAKFLNNTTFMQPYRSFPSIPSSLTSHNAGQDRTPSFLSHDYLPVISWVAGFAPH